MSYRKIGVAPVQPRCSESTPRISSLSALPRFFGEDGREGRQPVYWETWTESSIQTWSGSCAGAKDAMLRAGKENIQTELLPIISYLVKKSRIPGCFGAQRLFGGSRPSGMTAAAGLSMSNACQTGYMERYGRSPTEVRASVEGECYSHGYFCSGSGGGLKAPVQKESPMYCGEWQKARFYLMAMAAHQVDLHLSGSLLFAVLIATGWGPMSKTVRMSQTLRLIFYPVVKWTWDRGDRLCALPREDRLLRLKPRVSEPRGERAMLAWLERECKLPDSRIDQNCRTCMAFTATASCEGQSSGGLMTVDGSLLLAVCRPTLRSLQRWATGVQRTSRLFHVQMTSPAAEQRDEPNGGRASELRPPDWSSIAWSLGTLQQHHPSLWSAIRSREQELTPPSFVSLVWAMAKLQHREMPFLMREQPAVSEFNAQELSDFSWGAAKLRLPKASRPWELVAERGLQLMPLMKPQNMATVAWCFATVGGRRGWA
ncbi:Hypothetical protein SCF082_LOCUS14070 [Durusdinium trenchii]|uniref:Uncharacterized protein n=1 Tax=Durusdinium trenchii TaxID=1381693 RepID=A0ABP0JVI7_9DINO